MIILKKGTFMKRLFAALLLLTICFSSNFKFANAYYNKPTSYSSSPRLKNKYQRINGPCWAFANISTLETFLYKKHILKESLSEKHLLSWVNQTQNNPGWHISISHGGNSNSANGYFTAGWGPVFEREVPYNTNDTQFNFNLSSIKPKYWIKGIKNLNADINSIKNAISTYGAVTIIYSVNSNLNHAVSAIGWDDDKHSWLVKDSAKFPNNYTYLPYSSNILDCSCITDAEVFPSKIKIYQHDNFAITGTCVSDSKLTVANVFDFNGNETLDQVTIHSISDNAKINVYCAPVLKNGVPNGRKSSWQNLYSGFVPYKGYFTVNLNNKIRLNKNKYAIIVQIERTNNSGLPNIGYQSSHENLTLPPYQPGKSFILCGSNFLDSKSILKLENLSGFSIKAVTRKN